MYLYGLLVAVREFQDIHNSVFFVVGKGQILLDALCYIGVTASPQVKVTLTRHESAAIGAGTGDSDVILTLILSWLNFRSGAEAEELSPAWLQKVPAMSGKQELFESKSNCVCMHWCIRLGSYIKI